MVRMDSPSWTPNSGPRADSVDGSTSLVRWRRRGSAAELRFAEPARAPVWHKHWVASKALPAATSVSWWFLGAVGHAVATVGLVVGFGAAGLDMAVVWLGALVGLAIPPAAGVAGYFSGRRRQRNADVRAVTMDDIGTATTEALGRDLRGMGGKALTQKVAEAMRDGRSQRAKVFTASGYVEYRIDPVDERTVTISPVDSTPEVGMLNQFVRAVNTQVVGNTSNVTAVSDRRIAALEHRLAAIEHAGEIDRNHPNYPAFVILQVDRLTEYRQLAARAEAIAAVDTPEARRTATELAKDLDHIVELMTVGVDELERDVLAASRRSSDAHLGFLKDKYAAQ